MNEASNKEELYLELLKLEYSRFKSWKKHCSVQIKLSLKCTRKRVAPRKEWSNCLRHHLIGKMGIKDFIRR